jgi:hypothetical protein
MRRFAAFVAITMLVVNCTSSDEMGGTMTRSPGPSRSAATAIAVTPSPRWISDYCAEAARVIEPPVLCPARAPKGILPTENLDVLRPSAEGYVFEGDAETHWVFGASPADVEGDYGAMRRLGAATVRGTRGRWLYAPESAGIHAGHLVLEWRVGHVPLRGQRPYRRPIPGPTASGTPHGCGRDASLPLTPRWAFGQVEVWMSRVGAGADLGIACSHRGIMA